MFEEPEIIVHPRIYSKYGIPEEDVIAAWKSSWTLLRRTEPRNSKGFDEYVTVGFDRSGRSIAMTASYHEERNAFLIFHANRPAPKASMKEYGELGGLS